MSRGFIDAGIDVIRAYDAWTAAVETYRRNVGGHVRQADLADVLSVVPEITALTPDLIFGGPPCQDYSTAGKRIEGRNASLTVAFAIIVATVRPEWFVMENVVRAHKSEAWTKAQQILRRAGYGFSVSKVNAAYYGVPQNRRRLLVVGRLGERDGFLESAIASAAAERPMTLRDLFEAKSPDAVFLPARNGARCSVWSADELMPTIRSASGRPLPEGYVAHSADAALIQNGYIYSRPVRAGRGVRSIDEPFPTVTRTSWERAGPRYLANPNPGDPVCASAVAQLTFRQIARIQGFPENWEWPKTSRQHQMQMIANAVPPPVSKVVGTIILSRHMGNDIPAVQGRFLEWLVGRGRSRAVARNVKANLNRARRLLGGRTFVEPALEIHTLETSEQFQCMSAGTKSDLRQALRLYAEYLAQKQATERNPRDRNINIFKRASTEVGVPDRMADAALTGDGNTPCHVAAA
ncbi:DNA cytosine methyltransferase [Rhizobium sp. C4]|nr:DNA cytosine methyltransferase [Rhizobium sp. C4]